MDKIRIGMWDIDPDQVEELYYERDVDILHIKTKKGSDLEVGPRAEGVKRLFAAMKENIENSYKERLQDLEFAFHDSGLDKDD